MAPHELRRPLHASRTRLLLVALVALLAPLLTAGQLHAAGASSDASGRPAQASKPRALFFGDSYFVGGGCTPDPKQNMAYLAGVELGYRPVIRGAGGTGFVAANPEYDLPAYLEQIRDGALDVKNPALVVISGGSNDLFADPAEVRNNAAKVLRIARRKYPSALLVMVGPLDPNGGYADTDPIEKVVRKAAKDTHVAYIDDEKWLGGHEDMLCDDYVHPTAAGHVYLGHRLAKALARLGA